MFRSVPWVSILRTPFYTRFLLTTKHLIKTHLLVALSRCSSLLNPVLLLGKQATVAPRHIGKLLFCLHRHPVSEVVLGLSVPSRLIVPRSRGS